MLKFTPVVGQPVATYRPGSWGEGTYSTGYVVVKVTPKGQIVIRREVKEGVIPTQDRRFDKDGVEMGKSSYSSSHTRLVSVEEATQAIELRAKRNAVIKAFDQIGHKAAQHSNVSMGDRETYLTMVAELEVMVADARKAAEAMLEYPIR